jgi:hypothetical protein
MRDLHIGTTRHGGRLHLAGVTEDGRGFSQCGRKIDGEQLWAVGERDVSVDSPWCGSCLNGAVRDGVRWAEIDYRRARQGEGLFRVTANERSPEGNEPGYGDEADRWDGDTEIEIGEFILAHLERHPAPAGSCIAPTMERWGERLVEHGNALLDDQDGDA